MARQLEDMIKPFSQMTYEEQREIVLRVRHNKYTARPAAAQKKKAAKKKATAKSSKKVSGLLSQLSPEEIDKLKQEFGHDVE